MRIAGENPNYRIIFTYQAAMYKQNKTTLSSFQFFRKCIYVSCPAAVSAILTVAFVITLNSVSIAEESCTELLTNRCETCHYNTRVCQKVQKKKGKGSWKRTIKNMVKQGAKLDKSEQKQLVACLSSRAPEILEFCNLKK